MLSFKKVYREELLQLALLLSLLRVNNDPFQELDIYDGVNSLDFENGTSWQQITPAVLRSHYVNPKSLDAVLLNYERDLFDDVHSLGRFNRQNFRHPDVTTYLLNIERSATVTNPEPPPATIPPNVTTPNEHENSADAVSTPTSDGIGLSQEDMDLIEVLWKQDVDLGFSVENAAPKPEKPDVANENNTDTNTDDIEKLKTLQAINKDKDVKEELEDEDPWAGLDYTIDTETGEYVVKEELSDTLSGAECVPSCDLQLGDLSLPLPEFFLDEALKLVDLEDESAEEAYINLKDLENLSLDAANVSSIGTSASAASAPNLTSPSPSASSESAKKADDLTASEDSLLAKDADNEFDFLDDMIQTPQFHHSHHRAGFQTRMPFVRTMSMEQRWQDLANLLSLPGGPGGPGDAHGHGHGHGHGHPAFAHPLNYGHHHHPGGPAVSYATDASTAARVLLHNASLAPPLHDFNSSVPYSNLGGTNLGNAVATSMNLTNSSEPMGESSSAPHYKLEPSHDVVYYQNSSSEINQTDGFLSSILNDEDLQLMDMAMNEGLYTMRMLDGNNGTGGTGAGTNVSNVTVTGGASGVTAAPSSGISRHDMERMDTSSDSAVSSMGSERVPSLSDGEWGDGGSDSGHTSSEHYVTDYHNKMRPYDYSYSSRQLNNGMTSSDSTRIPPVAQKKHHMYGKRYFQEHNASASQAVPPTAAATATPMKYEYREPTSTSASASSYLPNPADAGNGKMPEMKYSCSMEFGLQGHLARNNIDHIQHNHTYHLPPESSGVMQRPLSRDKKKGGKAEDEHLTRDEKRARALNVPIAVDDIINLPMDEFNERLSKYDLSEAQLSLIRDIRRRGKNKVAAQNCRKRKLDQILSLADEVKEMRDRKMRLINDHEYTMDKCKRMKDKYQQLYRHVFQNLRDPDGNQYSPYQYSLQASADGTILMVPRSSTNVTNSEQKDPPQNHKD